MDIDYQNITIDVLQDDLFAQKQVTVSVLRLDKIHPIISGNKLFKLYYFLQQTKEENKTTIITFGGAYSNHLAATAYACALHNIRCIGIVRGQKPAQLSHTLQQCLQNNMQLQFVSREEYDKKETAEYLTALQNEYPNSLIIPEGGYDELGSNGAALIKDLIKPNYFTHICLAVGTATTLGGIAQKANSSQQIIAIPVLKGMTDIEQRIFHLTKREYTTKQLFIWDDYHFGGYAKKTPELIHFMNECWLKYRLPLDFVYTAKVFYSIVDNIKKDFFKPNSHILFIHTGGLQGNLSLPNNSLLF
jgi:1-aminocyclopropane-1-carboxylate deaminase